MLDFYARHKLCLHHAGDLMVALRPFPEEGVNLVYEHDTRLRLPSEGEERSDEFVRLAVPLVCQYGGCNVDESGTGLLRESFCEHSLPTSWGTEEEDTFRCP